MLFYFLWLLGNHKKKGGNVCLVLLLRFFYLVAIPADCLSPTQIFFSFPVSRSHRAKRILLG